MNIFKSEVSCDIIHVEIYLKAHRAVFNFKVLEKAIENAKLINDIENTLRKNDVKWIEFDIREDVATIPVNSVCYKNKYTNNMACHIEDFKRFYYANLNNIIKVHHVKNNKKNDSKGWTIVKSPGKDKKDRYDEIIKELKSLDNI